MTENRNPITQKYLDLEQQLSYELSAFAQNVSALQDAPTQEQYDRLCGHLNYIQLLLGDADRITRALKPDRNDPSFYQLLEAKDRMREHGITYASLRGSFFQQYSREAERNEPLERVLTQEELHPEIEDIIPSEAKEEIPEEEPDIPEDAALPDLDALEDAEKAKVLAAKKKKRLDAQRRLEDLRRRQLAEQDAAAEAQRQADFQAEHQHQLELQEQERLETLDQGQTDRLSRESIREDHDTAASTPTSVSYPETDVPSSDISQREDAELQRARWEEAKRLGIHQDPTKEISQAQLSQERAQQEYDRMQAEQAAQKLRDQQQAVQERFHQRQQEAEEHVRLEKGHVDFSRDIHQTAPEQTASDAPDITYTHSVPPHLHEEQRQPHNPSARDAAGASPDSPADGPENGQNPPFSSPVTDEAHSHRADPAYRTEDQPSDNVPPLSHKEQEPSAILSEAPADQPKHHTSEMTPPAPDLPDTAQETCHQPAAESFHKDSTWAEPGYPSRNDGPAPQKGWHNQTVEPEKHTFVPPLAPRSEQTKHIVHGQDTPSQKAGREVPHVGDPSRSKTEPIIPHQSASAVHEPIPSGTTKAPESTEVPPDWFQRRQERHTPADPAPMPSANGRKSDRQTARDVHDPEPRKQTPSPISKSDISHIHQNHDLHHTGQVRQETAAAKPAVAPKTQTVPQQTVYQFTPGGVREDMQAKAAMQPSRNNAQIYESIKKGMQDSAQGPVTLSSAYVSNMAWNVHMARIDYQSKKDTPEALSAVHNYQRQRQALNNLKEDIRAGRIVLEDPKPTTPKPAPGKSAAEKAVHSTQYHFTPQGVTGTTRDNNGNVTGTVSLNTRAVRENFRYNREQPLFVSPKYEQAMQQRLDRATTVLDTALKLDQKLPPKISADLHSELQLAQDAYAAFRQAKTTGAVVISDQSKLEKPDFHTWQQRKQANIFGTTVHSKTGDLNKPKKEAVEEHGSSILHNKSKLRTERFYHRYARSIGSKSMSYAWHASNLFSRNLYMLAQMGEDNALRTFETGRYYTVAAAQLGYAVTHLHVVTPNKTAKHASKRENHTFAMYVNKDTRTLSREIGDKKRLARENKKVLRSLRAEQAQLSDQIQALQIPGKTLTKEESLLMKQLGDRQRKVGEKLGTLQRQQNALNRDLRKEVAYVKLRKKNADEVRILRELREKHGHYITKGMLRRDISDTQERGRAMLLKKYGKNLTVFSDKTVKAEIKNLQKQTKAIKAQIKLLQSKGAALNQAQRQALKHLMDEHKAINKKLGRLIALNKDRAAINAELALKGALLNRMYKNSAAFSNSLLALKQFILRPLREGAEYGVQGFGAAFGIVTNRQVHRMLRKVFKVTARSVPAAALTLFTGDAHAVSSVLTYTSRAATIAKVKTRKFVKTQTKNATTAVVKGAKKTVSAITPQPVKKGVHYTAKAVSGKYKTFTVFKRKLSNYVWSSSIGRGLGAVGNLGSNAAHLLKTATTLVKSVAIKVVAGFVLLFLLCGVIASLAGAPAGGAVSSVIMTPYETGDGKLDLGPYHNVLNSEWQKYEQAVEGLRTEYADDYDRVMINMPFPDDNSREILSMMAVRMYQDLDMSENPKVKTYLESIFADSHYLPDTRRPLHTTQVSEKYQCSGCEERWIHVGHNASCPEGCNAVHREKETYCPGEHQDITVNLYILFFDEIFTADSMGNAGFEAVNGAYIGDFKITHYCACMQCCGKTDGITASGAVAKPNHTIAVDTSVIPLGSHVMIDGIEYVAEDIGGAIDGMRIDIYVSSHEEALQKGTFTRPVYYAGYAGGSMVETGEWDGWTEDNIFWCKNIYSMDWTELYSGIPNVTDMMGNETNLDGVTFIDGDRAGNESIVNTAMAELGQHGGQPYWSWYGFPDRVEWCATFVSWCAGQEGVLGTSIPKFASCRYEGVPWFQSHGQWAAGGAITPVAGDIIFFDWEGDGVPNHVGIVIGTDGSKVYTIEGNSGDTVRTKSYDLNSKLIFGYGLPNY